ncbi:MAG: 2-dehydropantoate 2-reductase [Spirochaetales bacterium]|nr:2-dehydropantoate 2-reductase [Leptospiraceae bacterium]MCP5483758.1 2-dehydropantoate 2-reductase [Spirochaetales bacterium]
MQGQTNIGIFGAGSIGCYIGAHLMQAGFTTQLLGRESLKREVEQHGLSASNYKGANISLPPGRVRIETDARGLSAADIVLVTVKSGDTRAAGEALQSNLKKGTIVVSFQNGLSNASLLEKLLPDCQVLGGMVPFNVIREPGARFHCGTSGNLMIAAGAASERVSRLLGDAGLRTDVRRDLPAVLRGKLIFNLNNALNALAGVPLREELSDRAYRRILAAAMEEARAVFRAGNEPVARVGKMIPWLAPKVLRLPNWLFFRIAASMIKIDPEARSSMWEDLERKRTTEIDYLNGEILSRAAPLGMTVPVNATIVSLIRDAEKQKTGSPRLSAATLQRAMGSAFPV